MIIITLPFNEARRLIKENPSDRLADLLLLAAFPPPVEPNIFQKIFRWCSINLPMDFAAQVVDKVNVNKIRWIKMVREYSKSHPEFFDDCFHLYNLPIGSQRSDSLLFNKLWVEKNEEELKREFAAYIS